jgi:hypothetical protein
VYAVLSKLWVPTMLVSTEGIRRYNQRSTDSAAKVADGIRRCSVTNMEPAPVENVSTPN